MDDALTMAIQALHNSVTRLETISHNVANAGTPGFKRSVPLARSFEQSLAGAASSPAGAAPQMAAALDASAAMPLHTGRTMDLLAEGGFFELLGSEGIGYARSGSFSLNPAGQLTDARGARLQGSAGALQLSGDDVAVLPDGSLQQRGRTAGAIRLVSLPDGPMVKGADGLLRPASGAQVVPLAEGTATVRTGYLESSNVSTVRETAMLMETSRGFESLSRLISAYDEQIGSALQKLGEF